MAGKGNTPDIMALLNARPAPDSEWQAATVISNNDALTTVDVEIGGETYRLDPAKVMGVHIWPAAHSLAENIVAILEEIEPGQAWSMELGAGAALPSLVAARRGYRISATDDDPATLDLVRRNMALNHMEAEEHLRVRTLNWSDAQHVQDLIAECPGKYACVFGSDIIYAPSDIRPLLKCAAALLAPGPRSRLVLAMTAHRFSQLHHTFDAHANEYGFKLAHTKRVQGSSVFKGSHLCTTGSELVCIYIYAWQ